MAKHSPWVGLFYSGDWQDVTSDVRVSDGISVSWGKKDETSAPVPTSVNLTFDNRTGKYNPRNPLSPLYGLVGRNTPLQVAAATPTKEGFEDTSYDISWSTSGAANWARSSTQARTGTWSVKAGSISVGQLSIISFTNLQASNTNTLSFWYKTEMSTGSFLSVYVGGQLLWYVAGTGAAEGWAQVILDTAGDDAVQIEFQRGGTASNNTVYIDDVRILNARATVEVTSWTPDSTENWDPAVPTRGDAWVDVEGKGLLQRINQSSDPIQSPLYRFVTQQTDDVPAEYWPCEDVAGAYQAISANGGTAMVPVTQVRYTTGDGQPIPPGGAPTFASGAGVPGSDKLPSYQQGGTLRGQVRSATFNGYAIDFAMQFQSGAADGATSVDVFRWQENGTYVSWTVNVTSTSVTVFHANAADAATLSSTGSAAATINLYDGAPHMFRVQVRQSTTNYLAELYIDGFLYATSTNFVPPMAGTVGRPIYVEWNPLEDRGDYMPIAAGQVVVWPSGAVGAQPNTFSPAAAWAEEEAADRLVRLAAEEGWDLLVNNLFYDTITMGPQPIATLGDQLKEIERSEDGLLTDQRGNIALLFRTRSSEYNQTGFALTYGTGMKTLRPVLDDQGTRNDVQVKNSDGAEARAIEETGPMSILSPVDGGVGRYPATIDVNVATDVEDLQLIAWWWNGKGTVEAARYPVVTLDLDAAPSLAAEAYRLTSGDRLTIADLEYETVDLRVLGGREVLGSHELKMSFNCDPGEQWQTGVYDDTVKRYDSATTTLSTGYNTTAASLVLTIQNQGDLWSTTSEPYDILVQGERITVTSMAAATGSGPYSQTATVTRSVNGVVKSLTSGASVRVANPGRYAL